MYKLTGDRVLILPEKTAEQTTAAGIILPTKADKRTQRGTIVAVGPGRQDGARHVPVAARLGLRVIYDRHRIMEKIADEENGIELHMVHDDSVFAAIDAGGLISEVFGDDILLAPEGVEDKVLESGLVLPEVAQKKAITARVVKHGPGLQDSNGLIPAQVEVGDRVLYAKHNAFHLQDEAKQYHLVPDCDILAIVDDSDVVTQVKEGLR